MTDPALLRRMGTDAQKWAEEFCKRAKYSDDRGAFIQKDTITGWFANAIEAGRAAGAKPVESKWTRTQP